MDRGVRLALGSGRPVA
jgi:transposase